MENINKDLWKYNLQLLKETSDEFKLVKDFFNTTSTGHHFNSLELSQVYKVIEKNTKDTDNVKSSNLMLFHGTSEKGVAGILKTGYRNSARGRFGRGVYLTESSDVASVYSGRGNHENDYFMFVNEILESQKLRTVFHEDSSVQSTLNSRHMYSFFTPVDELRDVEFTKYVNKSNMKIGEEQYKKDRLEKAEQNYGKDVLGRRYRKTAVDWKSITDNFVADCRVTIPRYLIRYQKHWVNTRPGYTYSVKTKF